MISSEIVTRLRRDLEPMYDEKLREGLAEPWRIHWCDDWTQYAKPIAQTALQSYNSKTSLTRIHCSIEPEICSQLQAPGFHDYLLDTSSEDPLIIDGTYLQMATQEPRGVYGHILITPISELTGHLAAAGVAQEFAFIWQPAVPTDFASFYHVDS